VYSFKIYDIVIRRDVEWIVRYKLSSARGAKNKHISIVKPTRCTNVLNFILFWKDTVHISDRKSDGLSVRYVSVFPK